MNKVSLLKLQDTSEMPHKFMIALIIKGKKAICKEKTTQKIGTLLKEVIDPNFLIYRSLINHFCGRSESNR